MPSHPSDLGLPASLFPRPPLPSCLSVGLLACVSQLPCQPGSACPALRFVASCAAGQGVSESASVAGASPEPSLGQKAAPGSRECIPVQGGSAGPAQPGQRGWERPGPSGRAISWGLGHRRQDRPQLPGRSLAGRGVARVRGRPLYLEVQDDGPDQAEGQLGVAVGNVVIPDVDQLHLREPAVLSPAHEPRGKGPGGLRPGGSLTWRCRR